MTLVKKFIEIRKITNCWNCPNSRYDERENGSIFIFCIKDDDRVITNEVNVKGIMAWETVVDIPDWCPLDDFEEKESGK